MVTHGHTGLLAPVGDAAGTAQHLSLLLEQEQYRLFLGQNAKTFALKHWSLDLMIERMLNVYYGVLAQKSSM